MFSFWTSATLTLKLWKCCHSVTYMYVSGLDISVLVWLVSLSFFVHHVTVIDLDITQSFNKVR